LAKFLTAQWLDELTAALAAHEGFKNAISSTQISLQFEVSDAPEGAEKAYAIVVDGGAAKVNARPLTVMCSTSIRTRRAMIASVSSVPSPHSVMPRSFVTGRANFMPVFAFFSGIFCILCLCPSSLLNFAGFCH